MQYLDLVRDCIDTFSLEELPPNDVQNENTVGGAEDEEDDYWYDDDDDDDQNENERFDDDHGSGENDNGDGNPNDESDTNSSNDDSDADSPEGSDNDPDNDSDDEALDSSSDDSDDESDDDTDDGDYATDNNDKTSKDINLTTFKFAADDYIFHKNHHKVSELEKPKRKKKNPTDPKAAPQATITGPVDGI